MHIARLTLGTAIVLSLTLAPIEAAPKGRGSAPIKVTSSKAPTTTGSKAPKATTTAKSGAPKTHGPKTTTTSDTRLARAEARSAKKSGTTSTTTSSTSTSPTTSSTSTSTTTATVDFTQGKVGERLTKNTKLAEKLANQLSSMGYTGDVYQAGYGFKNVGQFVAAVNNAQNHEIPFEQLKTLMTGRSVSPEGVVSYANLNPDGTVSMVPLEAVTSPAPTKSLGQAKQTIANTVETETRATTTGTK